MKTFIISNEHLSLEILSDFGGKIISIADDEGFEFLFPNRSQKYNKPHFGSAFEKYDTSGMDECFPTIDACTYLDEFYPDHGDLWSADWNHKEKERGIVSYAISKSSGLEFFRRISLDENKIIFAYEVKNPTREDKYYLWAQHGLLQYRDNISLEFPFDKEHALNVIDGSYYDFDIGRLSEYPDLNSYKFYNSGALRKGEVRIQYEEGRTLIYRFDPEKLPYLGFWFTKGGFKGEYNFAVEPSNGFYDSLKTAISNGCAPVPAYGTHMWEMTIELVKEN